MIGGRNILGAGVDPRLFSYDFSGAYKIGENYAQGIRNLGASIGGAIESYAEAKEKRKKIDASTKASRSGIESAIKLGEAYGIDVKSSLEPILAKMDDPNTTPMEAAMYGEEAKNRITNVLNMGITASERENAQQRAMMEQQYKAAQLGMRAEELGLQQQRAAMEASAVKSEEVPVVNAVTGAKDSVLINRDAQGRMRDPESGKVIKDLFKYGNEMEGWEAPDQPEMPPTSQVSTPSKINQSALSGPLRQYSSSFEEYGNKYGVDPALLAAIAEHETGGGKSSAFRNKNNAMGISNASGPIKMPSVEASIEKMASLLGRGINEGRGPYANAKSIEDIGRKYAPIGANNDPRNLNRFWTSGVKSKYEKLSTPQSIDNAISMGDGATQAIGTPQQRAEVARMIEEGAGMATAQNMPQGAMPTEPSMTMQQPQLPQQAAPPVNRRLLSSRQGKAAPVIMTAEQVKNLEGQGFRVSAMPTPEGTFMVSGVTTGGKAPRFTKTPEEELQSQRLTNLDKEQAELRSAGLAASQDISQLKQITSLLDTSVKTGFGREVIMKAKRVVGADVANEEQFQALVGNEAMKNIALTKGAISDREMEYFKTVLSPNMGKTTEGNKKIIDFKIKYAERASKIAKTITKMQSEGKSPFEIQEKVSNIIGSEPIISEGDATTPINQAESDANFLEGFRSGE